MSRAVDSHYSPRSDCRLHPCVHCRWLAEFGRHARGHGPIRVSLFCIGGLAYRFRWRLSRMADIPFLATFTSTALRRSNGTMLWCCWLRRHCLADALLECTDAWRDYFDDRISLAQFGQAVGQFFSACLKEQ